MKTQDLQMAMRCAQAPAVSCSIISTWLCYGFAATVIICASASTGYGQSVGQSANWATITLNELQRTPQLDWPVLDDDLRLRNTSFRAEYHVIGSYRDPAPRRLSWAIERSNERISAICYRPNELPFACLSGNELILMSASPQQNPVRVVDCFLDWNVDSVASFSKFPGYRLGNGSTFHLSIRRVLQELMESAVDVEGDPSRRTVLLANAKGSRAEILLTRERIPGAGMISAIKLYTGDHLVAFTNIRMSDSPFTCTEPGGFLCETELVDERWKYQPVDWQLAVEQLKPWLTDPSDKQSWKTLNGDRAGLIEEKIIPIDRFTNEETRQIENLLRILKAGKANSLGEVSVRSNVLESITTLKELLIRRIVEPVRIQQRRADTLQRFVPDPRRSPRYLAGHERWRTAERLKLLGKSATVAELYSTLTSVCSASDESWPVRIAAADLLGELGIHQLDPLLSNVRNTLSDTGNSEFTAVLASVHARAGRVNEAELQILKESMTDDRISKDVRLICLEALLLLDRTAELDSTVYEGICNQSSGPSELRRRCLFAAGCSKEGRAVLTRIILEQQPEEYYLPAFFLAETSIGPNDVDWNRCLVAAENVALSRTGMDSLRVKASEIAWFGGVDRPFRDTFIRQVLASGEAEEFRKTGWRYLGTNSGGQRYASEFEKLLQSPSVDTRRWSAEVFRRACDEVLHDKASQEDVIRLTRCLLGDGDRQVRKNALMLFERLRKPRVPGFADELLSDMVEVSKSRIDEMEFVDICSTITSSLGRSLPIDPRYSTENGKVERRTDEDAKQIVQKYRGELQSVLDNWANELTTPVARLKW